MLGLLSKISIFLLVTWHFFPGLLMGLLPVQYQMTAAGILTSTSASVVGIWTSGIAMIQSANSGVNLSFLTSFLH